MSVPQILIFMLRHWFTCSQKPLVYLSLFIAQLTVPDECPAAQKLSSTSMTYAELDIYCTNSSVKQ
jgi:hypothetical protein